MRHLKLLTIGSLLSLSAHAAGPAVVAKVDRELWQAPINTPDSFDKASRASLLVYALTLQEMQKLSDNDMKAAFKIKAINRASVTKWVNKEFDLSLHNYQQAAKSCTGDDWTCIGAVNSSAELLKKAEIAQTNTPPALFAWRDNLALFSHTYIAEQLRLAALFPKTSSEIDTYNANEWTGEHFADRQFLLTFDDGPTHPQGETDDVLNMLAAHQKNAVFFVLGENVQNRIAKTNTDTLRALYKNQCVASHGWEHQSHATWEKWQDSIKRNQDLLIKTFPKQNTTTAGSFAPLFRPPYGQRKADSGEFFQQQNLQIVLWNLDSQDWNKQMDSEDIINRIRTLMLIKRHGVLLFHDVQPKAQAALPVLFKELGDSVTWKDCHLL